MGAAPTGTVTFLFTDIESSTQKWEENAAVMSESLKIHDSILAKIVEENNGYVFNTVGDPFCVAFSRAVDCLAASIEIQRQLALTEWPGPQIKVRMCIHTGEAEERDNDYFGPVMPNLCVTRRRQEIYI
jgi:class 3 adenylate cyclase